MNFRYKLKYYKGEGGEYTSESPCDKAAIKSIIRELWVGDDLPRGLELIVVSGADGHAIMLEHSGKEVFEVYFLQPGRTYLFHKKSRIALIHNTLSAFMDADYAWLEENLNRREDENRMIRDLILTKDFLYEVTRERVRSEFFLTLFFAILHGLLCLFLLLLVIFVRPFEIEMIAILLFIVVFPALLWLPGLFIHREYFRENSDLKVSVSKGNDIITVERDGVVTELSKKDIVTLTVVRNPWHRLPWSDYGYSEIRFRNGYILNLTNLIIDQYLMVTKFAGIDLQEKGRLYPEIIVSTSKGSPTESNT